jgi:hypothetical protein
MKPDINLSMRRNLKSYVCTGLDTREIEQGIRYHDVELQPKDGDFEFDESHNDICHKNRVNSSSSASTIQATAAEKPDEHNPITMKIMLRGERNLNHNDQMRNPAKRCKLYTEQEPAVRDEREFRSIAVRW